MEAPAVLVVTGPPGAGKTTVCSLLAKPGPRTVHLRADDFWHHISAGYVDPWRPEAHAQNEVVMSAVFGSAGAFWSGGYAVVLDGVIGPWFLEPIRAGTAARIPMDYVVIRPPLDVVLDRVRTRRDHGMRDLPATTSMYEQFSSLGPAYDRHVLDAASLSPEETARRIGEARDSGVLRLP